MLIVCLLSISLDAHSVDQIHLDLTLDLNFTNFVRCVFLLNDYGTMKKKQQQRFLHILNHRKTED